MPLALDQAHALLIAELSRDAATIAEAISAVLAMSPETSLLEVEEVFRDAGSPVYLIAKPPASGSPARIRRRRRRREPEAEFLGRVGEEC